MDFIYPLYLYMRDIEREHDEYVAKQEKLRQQEKLQKQIYIDKSKIHKKSIGLISKICVVASLVFGAISIVICNNWLAILSISSLALGIFSYIKMNYNNKVLYNIAKVGIVLSSIALIIAIVILIFVFIIKPLISFLDNNFISIFIAILIILMIIGWKIEHF